MSLLAYYEVGEQVAVGELPADYRGQSVALAGWDGKSYFVALAPDLAPEALLEVLYHELAHLRLGHVSKAQPTADTSHWPAALHAWVADRRRAQEAHAEAWAEAKLAKIPPNWRAALVERIAGEN